MPLDIVILDNHERPIKVLPFYITEYEIVVTKLDADNDFPILKEILKDYYGLGEIYLNQLPALKLEVQKIQYLFEKTQFENVNVFLFDFLNLVDFAMRNKRTIKLVGD